MRAGRITPVIMLALAVLAGCGSSAADQVRAKVDQFGHAAAAGDYKTICDRVLAPALIRHLTANGIPCEQALRVAFSGVRNPALSIGKVTVKGPVADVVVLSLAQGEQASVTTIELIKTAGGWRIDALRASL